MTAQVRAPTPRTGPDLRAASRATFGCFAGLGVTFSSWASEIPRVKAHEHLGPGALGLVLLAVAAGSVVALPLSGGVVHRLGSARAVRWAGAGQGLVLALVGVGYAVGLGMVVVCLFLFGFAMGTWDVAVNVQGAAIEQSTGRALLPRFHAGFSVGTVFGALVGAAAIATRVPVTVHLVVLGVLVLALVPPATRRFVPDAAGGGQEDGPRPPPAARRAVWTERRTLQVGLVALGFAFAEGTGNDWLSVSVSGGYHVSAATGTVAFAVFLAAMTGVRWYGPNLLGRFGRVPVLAALAALATAGLGLFALGPSLWTAFVGALLWGAGTSLGFPVCISAAADDPALAAPRVSVVVSVGYTAFLVGPPLIGLIGDVVTVRRGLLVVGALLLLAGTLVRSLRPPTEPAGPASPAVPT